MNPNTLCDLNADCSTLKLTFWCFHVADGLILFQNNSGAAPIQLAATAAFLSKIYSDYLEIVNVKVGICGPDVFSLNELQSFARSQVSENHTASTSFLPLLS